MLTKVVVYHVRTVLLSLGQKWKGSLFFSKASFYLPNLGSLTPDCLPEECYLVLGEIVGSPSSLHVRISSASTEIPGMSLHANEVVPEP